MPPVEVNPGFPARYRRPRQKGRGLAGVDAADNAILLYAWRDGGFTRIGSLPTGRRPAQIVAADLNGDGRDDLVVRNAGDGTLSVYFSSNFIGLRSPLLDPPAFVPSVPLSVGLGVSDVALADTTGDRKIDLVVTNKLSGQVSILRNRGNGTFDPPAPYRAGTGLYDLDLSSGSAAITSREATAGVAAGDVHSGWPHRPGDDQPRLELV